MCPCNKIWFYFMTSSTNFQPRNSICIQSFDQINASLFIFTYVRRIIFISIIVNKRKLLLFKVFLFQFSYILWHSAFQYNAACLDD